MKMKTNSKAVDLNKLKQIEDIKTKTTLVLEDRKNVNNLVDLLTILNEDIDCEPNSGQKCSQLMVETIIRSLSKIFIRFIHNKELVINSEESAVNKTYKNWLTDVYNQTNIAFNQIIGNNQYSKSTQKLSLNCLMKCVAEEGKYPFRLDLNESNDTFVYKLLNDICKQLLSSETDNRELIQNYVQNYLEFDDCIHYTLKAIDFVLEEMSEENERSLAENGKQINREMFARNTFELLSNIKLKTPADLLPRIKRLKRKASKTRNKTEIIETKVENIILCVPTQQNQKCFKIDYQRDADLFASVWTHFLRQELPKDLYKTVLTTLDKHLLPHFKNPLVLTDFLINSYDIGGVVSLLSLSSLYILIQKCNLNYPKFYSKLYALLSPGIVYVKYRPRFLFWTDVFLTSTHISSKIVASFVKRLSRIALTASCDAILILLPLIGNILIRHPTLVSMIRNIRSQSLNADPFDNTIEDPENTGAINSCLWEIKSLQNHFHPEVAKIALFINNELPNREWDLSELLETSFDDIIESSLKKLSQEKELTFDNKHSSELMYYLS